MYIYFRNQNIFSIYRKKLFVTNKVGEEQVQIRLGKGRKREEKATNFQKCCVILTSDGESTFTYK